MLPVDRFSVSYLAFVNFFASRKELTIDDCVVGAFFTYGWMPRIPKFKDDSDSLCTFHGLLSAAREGKLLTSDEIRTFASILDNSVVGVSKLLHFVHPNNYAIFDSRVARWIKGKTMITSGPTGLDLFVGQLTLINDLRKDPRFEPLRRQASTLMPYDPTPMRFAELVMFHNGVKRKESPQSTG